MYIKWLQIFDVCMYVFLMTSLAFSNKKYFTGWFISAKTIYAIKKY